MSIYKIVNNRILSVSSFIFDIDLNKICLITRNKEPYIYKICFPGGKIEYNKDKNYLMATKREVLEETGIEIDFPEHNLLEILEEFDNFIIILSILVCTISRFIRVKNEYDRNEIYSMAWLSQEEINKYIKEEQTTKGLLRIINKGFDFANIIFKENIKQDRKEICSEDYIKKFLWKSDKI